MSIAKGTSSISKLYLGSTEVSMAYLGADLVFGEPSSPYDEYGYIKSGKYFHLDGIDKGETANAWTDLVGGIVFNSYGSVTELTNGWELPGSNSAYLGASATQTQVPPDQNATIEVCFCPNAVSNNGFVFAKDASANSPMFLIYTDNGDIRVLNSGGGAGRRWANATTANTNYTISAEYDLAYSNGIQLTLASTSAGAWAMAGQTGYMRIGNRRRSSGLGSGQDNYKGKVFSIRIYNRKLTASEMLNNQRVDNIRFNLGLSI